MQPFLSPVSKARLGSTRQRGLENRSLPASKLLDRSLEPHGADFDQELEVGRQAIEAIRVVRDVDRERWNAGPLQPGAMVVNYTSRLRRSQPNSARISDAGLVVFLAPLQSRRSSTGNIVCGTSRFPTLGSLATLEFAS